ncbi:MAG: hypothetical protein KDC98_10120 [Planctomycetes bacterium]|nr:hypothetical protein [Planctomycetota bacterium]
MSKHTVTLLAAAGLFAACAAPTPRNDGQLGLDSLLQPGRVDSDTATASAMATAGQGIEVGEIARGHSPGAQPFRLRRAANLAGDTVYSQFRFELEPDSSAEQASFAYGISDDLTLDLMVGAGQHYSTLSVATDPGQLLDFGGQYRLVGGPGELTVSGRFDLVLSDEQSFQGGSIISLGGEGGPTAATPGSKKVSFQPSALIDVPFGMSGSTLFASLGGRFGDSTDPALAVGSGFRMPLGRVDFITEADIVMQSVPGPNVREAYLTPGIEWTVREKLDIALGVSIGLTRTSEDWRAMISMGVRI